ncbi:phospholipase/lecithinase/hemolysin [Silvimonas terrae]|uniref:Phospholipase/lecithinase/hemolysin n=1 Tax=Silvimonas terrae TaxID=300266 RepID=A0A840RIS6_9NEIS|nr:SGNH/GDSL hydrolase family protein [Silvimonas terrae]MBB5193609.1 phospholipase/lecithinase/hemolysin [Silvimonas terrae]
MRTNGIGALSALAAAVLLAACGGGSDGGHDFDSNNANQAQANIQQVVVFGDSLNDVGTYNPTTISLTTAGPTPPSPGLAFTTKPGAPWTSYVALNYNFYLQPYERVDFGLPTSLGGPGQVVTLGGTDYAQGGATVQTDATGGGVVNTTVSGHTVPLQEATALSVKTQIDTYLGAKSGFNAHQLVLINGGANDILNYFQNANTNVVPLLTSIATTSSLTAATASVTALGKATADNMVAQLQRLPNGGATNVVYANVPDIGATPFAGFLQQAITAQLNATGGQALGLLPTVQYVPTLITAMVTAYNQEVAAGIASTKIITFDANALLKSVQASPATYGMINVSSPACNSETTAGDPTTLTSLICTQATLVSGATDSNYLFADYVHPTNGAHKIWAQAVIQQIQASIPK